MDDTNPGNARDLTSASGADLIVLPGSRADTVEGGQRLREALASARPVLLARPPTGGPVLAVAEAPRGGLGAMAVAADEARRLGRALVVVHAAEGMVGVAKGELGPVSAMSLRAGVETIRRRWGVATETRAIESPCAPALSSLASALDAHLVVLGIHGGSGDDETARMQRILDVARASPCSVLLLPHLPEANRRLPGRTQTAPSLTA